MTGYCGVVQGDQRESFKRTLHGFRTVPWFRLDKTAPSLRGMVHWVHKEAVGAVTGGLINMLLPAAVKDRISAALGSLGISIAFMYSLHGGFPVDLATTLDSPCKAIGGIIP